MSLASSAARHERKERLEARITSAQKSLLQEAAELQGRTLTDFIVHAASEAARRVLRDRAVIRLTPEEQRNFVKALLDPPPPGPRLRAAARRYRKIMGR